MLYDENETILKQKELTWFQQVLIEPVNNTIIVFIPKIENDESIKQCCHVALL